MRTTCKRMGWYLVLVVGISLISTGRGQLGQPPAANTISVKGDNSTAGAVSFKGEFAGFSIACINKTTIQVYTVQIDPKTGVRTETPLTPSYRDYDPEVASGNQTSAIAAAKGTILRAVYTLDATGGNPTPQQAETTASTADVTVK